MKVRDHPLFKLEGRNIVSEIPISISEAIFGGKFTVDTIDGKLNLDMKPGINDGEEVLIKSYGMPPF
jgi:DnaJ-class molecular chaperone